MDKNKQERELEELNDAIADACRAALVELDLQRLLAEAEETCDSIKMTFSVAARPRRQVVARVTGSIKVVGEGVAKLEDPDQMQLEL